MSLEDKKEDYSWKDEARATVDEQLDKRLNGEINYNPIVSIESAVGTGKTSEVASNYADLILRLKDRKTFHAFVAPRILLAKQQCAAVQKYLDDEPGLKQEGIKVICKVYCSESSSDVSKEFPKEGEEHLSPNDKHIIYFYCDDSLWRDDENCQCSKRFEALLKNNVEFDRVNGKNGQSEKVYLAIENIVAQINTSFSYKVVETFKNTISAYPNGTLVLDNYGDVSVVMSQNNNFPTRPVLKVIKCADGSRRRCKDEQKK